MILQATLSDPIAVFDILALSLTGWYLTKLSISYLICATNAVLAASRINPAPINPLVGAPLGATAKYERSSAPKNYALSVKETAKRINERIATLFEVGTFLSLPKRSLRGQRSFA